MRSKQIATTCVLALLPILAWTQPTSFSTTLEEYLNVQQQRIGFAGSVLVVCQDSTWYEKHMGFASLELEVPLDENSVFRIASISKTFTAMLVALAVAEGKLSYEDSIATFFPRLPDSLWRQITIDQLLSHRSGIPHNEGIKDYWPVISRLSLDKNRALAEILKMELLFRPGERFHYSSPGYFLLARILEAAYRRPYAVLLEEKIIGPLGMDRTGVFTNTRLIPGMVSGYHLLENSPVVAPYRDASLMAGSGDLFATARDLATWAQSFDQDRWPGEIKEKLFSPHGKSGTPADRLYGYGWYIRPAAGDRKLAWYHGGGSFGCSALLAHYPAEKLSVVILSNLSTLPVNELWEDMEKILFGQPFEMPRVKKELPLPEEELRKFTGRYQAKNGALLQLFMHQEQLYAKLGDNPPFRLFAEGSGRFYGKKADVQFTFTTGDEGKITGLAATRKGQEIRFIKSIQDE